MEIITKFFGKKIKGEVLEGLLSALGKDPQKLLQTSAEKWSTRDAHGRVVFYPTKEGVNVDLYVFREDYHRKDGTLKSDNLDNFSLPPENSLLISNMLEDDTSLFEEHIQGEIKYKNVSQTGPNK
jgi:hypothetical protein